MSRRPAEAALDVQVCPTHAGRSLLIVGGRGIPREHAVSVADRLGLQDLEGELMCAARAAWRRWSGTHQTLAVVPELVHLRDWTKAAPADEANVVLGVLASLTETDVDAVTALVWALLPGAEARARKLRDLHEDVDGSSRANCGSSAVTPIGSMKAASPARSSGRRRGRSARSWVWATWPAGGTA